MNKKIYAGIVSFNPIIDRLKENVEAILPQIEKVVMFDNGSNNQHSVRAAFEDPVIFIESSKNIGIAAALNRLIEWGKERDYEWMISLDQDSFCGEDFVDKMVPFLDVEKNIGIVAPIVVDRDIGIVGHNTKNSWKEVRTCITSGSFNNIEAWKNIEGYDESMFIDSVDFEYCYRLRRNGYKVIQVNEAKILHKLGESKKRRFLFWQINSYGHIAPRKYYIARNNVYYPLKHHLWLHFARGNLRNVWLIVSTLIYENNKKEKVKSIIKGWTDGLGTLNSKRNLK